MTACIARRQFIALLGGAGVAWPLAGRAQESGRTHRLGFLLPSARQSAAVEALFDELRLNGFVEGKNLKVVPGGFEATDDNLVQRAAASPRAHSSGMFRRGARFPGRPRATATFLATFAIFSRV
jgi:putative tryptophan/tyrosine transport system substrate-binding protein